MRKLLFILTFLALNSSVFAQKTAETAKETVFSKCQCDTSKYNYYSFTKQNIETIEAKNGVWTVTFMWDLGHIVINGDTYYWVQLKPNKGHLDVVLENYTITLKHDTNGYLVGHTIH